MLRKLRLRQKNGFLIKKKKRVTAYKHQRQVYKSHIRTNQGSHTRSLHSLTALGMRKLGKGKNAALKLFAILNLGKPVTHAT